MKKFKDLFKEEIAADQKRPKGDTQPPKYLKPVSKGEQDFVDQHKVEKIPHPQGNDNVFDGDHKGPKAELPHEGGKENVDKEKGEKKPLKTYKSMVASAKSSARSADKRQGDMKPVMQGSSKVTEGVQKESMLGFKGAAKANGGKSLDPKHSSSASHIDYHHRQTGGHNKTGGDQDRHRYQVAKKLGYRTEGIAEEVEFIEEAFKKGMLKLKSGEMVKVDETAAKALNKAMGGLNSSNKKRMTAEAMKDKKSFMGIVKFAKSAM